MPLEYLFASGTGAPTSQLDANFQTVGLLGLLPCAVSGTNALTLTLLNASNSPTVSVYSNYAAFTFVAGNSNTGAVTATVGTIGALNVYKNSVAGPVALVAGDIIAGNSYQLTYNSALNAGAGGFLITGAPYLTRGQIPGTNTNDNASAGNVGELLSSSIASPGTTLTSGTVGTITNLALTAGDWDVWLEGAFTGATNTTVTNLQMALNTVATISTLAGQFGATPGLSLALFNYSVNPTLNVGPARFSVANSLTVYGLAEAVWATSSITAFGLMRARRVR